VARDSIFYKLAKDENSFIELLCNFLMRDEFRAQVLPLLCPETPASSITSATITTQEIDKDCGRPDIVIRSDEACGVVEVKLNPKRGFTSHQELPACEDSDRKSYLDYLLRQKALYKRFVVLVPGDWVHLEKLQQSIETVKKTFPQIQVSICFWEHILSAIETNPDSVVQEFRKVLMRQIALLTFSADELRKLHSIESLDAFRATRKLQIIVDNIANSQNIRSSDWERKDPQSYGFYIRQDQKCLLWFGIWETNESTQLCYAVSQKCGTEMVTTFRKFFQDSEVKEVGSDEKWTVAPVPNELLQSSDPVRQIGQQLNSLLEHLSPELIPANGV
jgi:hypothetical protein